MKKVWTTNSVGLDGYWLWVGGGQEDPWVLSCVTQGLVVPLNETGKQKEEGDGDEFFLGHIELKIAGR